MQRWILVAVLLAVQALSIGAVSYSFSLWVDPLAADFDVERKAILGLLGVFGIATCAASAIFGRFLDAGAPRTLLAIGVLALAAGLMLVAAAPALWSVYLIFLLIFPISMVFAGQLVAISLITRAFENRRGLALGITLTGGSIGGAIIPNVFAALIEDHGWRYTNFYFGLFTLVVLLPLVLIVVKPVMGEMRPAAAQEMPGVRDIFGKSAFWLAVASVVMLMAVFAAIQPNIAPLAVDLAIPVRSAALLITTFALAVVVGRILGGYLCDRMGMRTMWLVIVGVEICAIALLTQSPGLARLHVGLSLVGLGSGALAPLQATLFARIFGPAFVGRVLGLAMPFFAVVPISAMLAAWAREATGSYDVVFYVAIVVVGATVPFILLLKSEPNERLGPTASAIS